MEGWGREKWLLPSRKVTYKRGRRANRKGSSWSKISKRDHCLHSSLHCSLSTSSCKRSLGLLLCMVLHTYLLLHFPFSKIQPSNVIIGNCDCIPKNKATRYKRLNLGTQEQINNEYLIRRNFNQHNLIRWANNNLQNSCHIY